MGLFSKSPKKESLPWVTITTTNQLNELLAPKRLSINAPFIYLIDDVFKNNTWLLSRISLAYDDRIIFVSADEEPKTAQVDTLVEDIILKDKECFYLYITS